MKVRALALGLGLGLAACGPKPGGPTPDPDPALGSGARPRDGRTPIEQRRDAACEALGPRLTQCALDDAKLAAQQGTITQKQLADISVPAILRKNTAEFVAKCETPMSSRQVRVLEVCAREESECAPLLDCLAHLTDGQPARPH